MEKSFADCLVDIGVADFVKKFRSLHNDLDLEFGVSGISDKSIIKYIVSTYDMNSPFVIDFVNYAQRRKQTTKFANFPTEGNRWTLEADKIIMGNNLVVNRVVVRYLFLQGNLHFIRLNLYQALLFKQSIMIVQGGGDKPGDLEKLEKNVDGLTEKIEMLQKMVFHGDETDEYRKALYSFAENIRTDITPEDRADKLLKGEPIVDDVPFPGYEVEQMHFLDDE